MYVYTRIYNFLSLQLEVVSTCISILCTCTYYVHVHTIYGTMAVHLHIKIT